MSYNSTLEGAEVQALLELIPNKVDKVSGKGLSAEDFTSALKTKLEGLSNYDDTQIQAAVTLLRNDLDKLVSGDTTTAIKTFNEIIAFLDGVDDTQSLSGIIASIEQQIAGKMDKVTLAAVATSGSYNDLKDQPTIPAEQVNADWNATSGKARILNKPTIPAAVTESTVAGWGFTKNTGSYSKPSTGIPKSDLASAVQTSLGKADSAIQSVKTINGQSIVGSGDITIEGGGIDPKIATLQIPSNAWNAQYNNMMATGTISTAQYTEITNCATLRLDFGGGAFLESVKRHVDNNGYIVFTFLTDNYPYTVYIGQSEYYLYVYADPMFTKLYRLSGGGDQTNTVMQIPIVPGQFTVVEGVYGGVDVSWSDSYLMNYNTAVEGLMCGFQFTTGSNPIRLTLPDNIQLPSDFSIEANTTYVVTIFNNLALVSGWPNA